MEIEWIHFREWQLPTSENDDGTRKLKHREMIKDSKHTEVGPGRPKGECLITEHKYLELVKMQLGPEECWLNGLSKAKLKWDNIPWDTIILICVISEE